MSKRKGLLFINIGSPKSTSVHDVRTYLREFLTDKRIISLPYLFRHALVRGIIVPFRAPKSAKRYEQIWMKEGAPLDLYTYRLAQKVSTITEIPTYVTMRYKKGDTAEVLAKMESDGIQEVTLIPLFPQYSMSSFESSVVHVHQIYERGYKRGKYTFDIRTIPPFYNHSGYIKAWAAQLTDVIHADDHLLISFHGIPMDQIYPYQNHPKKDYYRQCIDTMEGFLQSPELIRLKDRITYEMVFQSRFDSRKWLSPTLLNRLKALPSEGKKNVVVMSPGFICDCLETLEEIGIDGRQTFIRHGGEKLGLVPAPNDSDIMAQAFSDMITSLDKTQLNKWISKD